MAAGSTYTPIYSTTLGSNQSTVSLSSFSGYTDLRMVLNFKNTAGGLAIKPNANGSSIYSMTILKGDGSSATSSRLTTADLGGTGWYVPNAFCSTTNFNAITVDFMNYTNTTTYKTILIRANDSGEAVGAIVGLAQTTSAVSSLELSCDGGGQVASGTSITLYGIAAA
jgi:hypothetical protein